MKAPESFQEALQKSLRKPKPDRYVTELGKLPPQALDLEEAVLGAILLEADAFRDVMTILEPESFYKSEHVEIYKACKSLNESGRPIDILTVIEELKRTDKLEFVGGPYFISELTNRVGSAFNIKHHALVIKEKQILRGLITLGHNAIQMGFSPESDPFDAVDKVQAELSKIANVSAIKEPVIAKNVFTETIKTYESKLQGAGIYSGITDLDTELNGANDTDLIIIAARPAMGKTAFMLEIAKRTCANGIPTVIFSLEMGDVQLMNRLIANTETIPLSGIRNKNLQPQLLDKLLTSDVRQFPLYIEETGGITVSQIVSKATKLKENCDLGLILVDYLQLVTPPERYKGDRNNEVSQITRELKKLAKELKVPVIALSQLSRAVESRGGAKRPQMSDLRDSGCLHGDTKIFAKNQTIEIRNLDCDKSFSIFGHNTYPKIMEAKKCWKTKQSEVLKLTLTTGHEIMATGNHKFYSNKGWLPLSEIDKNLSIAIPINFEDNGLSDYSNNLSYLMGAMIANGKMLKRQAIVYTCNIEDEFLAQSVSDIIQKEFDCEARVVNNLPKYNWLNVYAKSVKKVSRNHRNPMVLFFENQGIYDKRAKNKTLPESIFWQSKANQLSMLAGLFDNDGTIHLVNGSTRIQGVISYSSSSLELINQIQVLLQMNGIIARIKELKKGEFTWYNLYLSDKASKLIFCKTIPLKSKRKIDQINLIYKRLSDIVAGWSKIDYNENKTLAFVEIKSIEKVEGVFDVYDIEVPESRNFVANGILVHNSIEQDADSIMFLYRPEYYGIMEDDDGLPTTDLCEIILAKHRHGDVGTYKAKFLKNYQQFTEYEKFSGVAKTGNIQI